MKRTFWGYLTVFIKGMAMGAADVVPGVSGGTIAFISGIYEEFITSLKSINAGAFVLLFKEGLHTFWRHINAGFLLSVFIGIGISVFSLAKLISVLLEEHPVLIWSFFFGLIIASAFMVAGRIGKWTVKEITGLLAGAGMAYFITVASPANTPESWWFILLSGMVAICAMILPGISGSFILLLLGKYAFIIGAVANKNISVLCLFALGCIIGLLSFSHILSWMFRKYHDFTIAVLTGFMVGSLNKVWPWKIPLESRLIEGVEKVIREKAVLPNDFTAEPHIVGAALLACAGFLLIVLMERMAAHNPKG